MHVMEGVNAAHLPVLKKTAEPFREDVQQAVMTASLMQVMAEKQ